MVFAIIGIAFLGWIVWGHHMFMSGMNPTLGSSFMVSTLVIAVPSAVKVFNWMGTMWRGKNPLPLPLPNPGGVVAEVVVGGAAGGLHGPGPRGQVLPPTLLPTPPPP